MEIINFGATSPPTRQIHCHAAGGPLLQEVLRGLQSGRLPADNERARWLIEFGAVYVSSQRVTDTDWETKSDDLVRIHLDPKRYSLNKAEIKKRVVFENADFLVVDKTSGIPMHPTLDNLRENLLWAFENLVYVTHRLDVPTSGLCVLAKTKRFQTEFNRVVSKREIRKIYQAWVSRSEKSGSSPDLPGPGLLRHFMKVSVKAPKEVVSLESVLPDQKYDECLSKILSSKILNEKIFELEIELVTGRTHQIRAQLACEGMPLLGDEMYGGQKSEIFGLHASTLEFRCPLSGEQFSFSRHRTI
jgi:23S rRNA pseudouridine1911/1915/1917 synthase